ncbi:MAG TPA: type II secretion system F family protein [Streptosporangiales bacterium]
MTLLAMVCAAAAGWLVVGRPDPALRVAVVVGGSGPPPVGAARAVAAVSSRWLARLRAWRTRRGAAEALVELCTGFAAELRAGRPPIVALRLAAGTLPAQARAELRPVLAAAGSGGDVPAAMRVASGEPGWHGLAWLAACWQVGVDSGAGLADAVERLAGALRDDQRAGREVAAQLAAPRATARLLAALPVLGIALSTALGQRPLSFLFGSGYGLGCLVVGVAVDVAGVVWTTRLARSVAGGAER